MNFTVEHDTTRFPYSYFTYNDAFLTDITHYLSDKKVLEVFAGNGKLASLLQAQGIHIKATSIHSGHDGHEQTGFFTTVENMGATDAVRAYREDFDVLLMCWPTVTPEALRAAFLWQKPILFIGEVSDVKKLQYGGCATDAFFEHITITHIFDTYRGNYLEKAFMCEISC